MLNGMTLQHWQNLFKAVEQNLIQIYCSTSLSHYYQRHSRLQVQSMN